MEKIETPVAVETTLNIVKFIELRNHIALFNDPKAKPKIGFNMGFWRDYQSLNPFNARFLKSPRDRSIHNCGTSCCLYGHAAQLWLHHQNDIYYSNIQISITLGLTHHEQSRLSGYGEGLWNTKDLSIHTIDHALKVLDWVIVNGKIPYAEDMGWSWENE